MKVIEINTTVSMLFDNVEEAVAYLKNKIQIAGPDNEIYIRIREMEKERFDFLPEE